MKLKEGLVALSDTRITSGSECLTAKKVSLFQGKGFSLFVQTSGLRSVRDKSLTYFGEMLERRQRPPDKLFKVVNILAEQLRRVKAEDEAALKEAGFPFNFHALLGGQMAGDPEPKLYLLYPQGNWVEIGEGTPYQIIGAPPYGKPVLDRTLKFGDSLAFALKVGCLAFDSTRISAADVGFPLDVVILRRGLFTAQEHRFQKEDLEESTEWWMSRLRGSVDALPSAALEAALAPPPLRLQSRAPRPLRGIEKKRRGA